MKRAAAIALLLAGCNGNMVQQPRYDDYERSPLFADGKAPQAAPDGTVDRQAPQHAAETMRPPLDAALMARGRERYGIYCAMCHGLDGRGEAVLPARGFPKPPSLLEPRLVAAPSHHVYDVVTNGYGVMYAYSDRVSPRDRWAIAAYVQALQTSGGARAR